MEFTDTAEEAAFRAECREWLEANAERRPRTSGVLSILGEGLDGGGELARARDWQAKAAAEGWAGIHWPPEYGGRGASLIEQVIWAQEAARFEIPDHVFRIGIAMGGPTVIAHGSDDQKRRWLPPLLTGEEIWCQLFSEPGAGSDLASLRTTAVRDGDAWVVDGQKVWSSGAHYSKWGMLVARTDMDAPKHSGITYFLLEMNSPGIDIRPLKQMTGASHFSEVFFDDVRLPDTDRLGGVNEGWKVAQTTLLNERAALGELLGGQALADGLVDVARRAGTDGRSGLSDPRVRQEIAEVYANSEILRYLGLRIVTAISRGGIPGGEASVIKIAMARLLNRAAGLGVRLGGPSGLAGPNEWWHTLLAAPAVRIAGGSDEIQRNIIGERVLGLPKEPGSDRDTPFNELPHSVGSLR
ncbi:MAG: acyl-CoA dehydrogenase [Actinobacteria bacterium]|nr:MAG: acyl-CoA dehydrogenase [Actinomycetota bacterium]RIK04329.1 MAG: acyl-CoA dehydrogenase [Acidobacteriota bacterium]